MALEVSAVLILRILEARFPIDYSFSMHSSYRALSRVRQTAIAQSLVLGWI
jgi:hypothetical protein